MAPVVQKMDGAIHWINHYSLDNAIANSNTGTYPLDLVPIDPGVKRFPDFEQRALGDNYGYSSLLLIGANFLFIWTIFDNFLIHLKQFSNFLVNLLISDFKKQHFYL